MAIIINPDGTVSTMEVNYDAYGNIRPKIPEEIAEKTFVPSKDITFPKKQKKKRKKAASPAPPKTQGDAVKSTKIVTRHSIDRYFAYIKSHHQKITEKDHTQTLSLLKGELLAYYEQRYFEYKMESLPKPASAKNKKPTEGKKKKKKKNKETQAKQFISRSSGFSIAEIASFSSLKGALPGNDIINGRSIYGASRKPKYGYARDRFGRVQERDSLNEERKNEFKQAQRNQSSYDYSGYDVEDDHDSYYDSNEYK